MKYQTILSPVLMISAFLSSGAAAPTGTQSIGVTDTTMPASTSTGSMSTGTLSTGTRSSGSKSTGNKSTSHHGSACATVTVTVTQFRQPNVTHTHGSTFTDRGRHNETFTHHRHKTTSTSTSMTKPISFFTITDSIHTPFTAKPTPVTESAPGLSILTLVTLSKTASPSTATGSSLSILTIGGLGFGGPAAKSG